jgi:hypothetical protein
MRQRGKKTLEHLAALVANGDHPRLIPPAFLKSDERSLFEEIVGTVASTHFVPSDLPLLVSFVQWTVLARRMAGKPDQLETWEKATRVQMSLATKLRLTPQTRIDPKTLARHQPSPYPPPWITRDDDRAEPS